MIGILIFSILALLLLGAFLCLARRAGRRVVLPSDLSSRYAELSAAGHCRNFGIVRRALSEEDENFLAQRASSAVGRRARTVRRAVALQFMAGVREDYSRLDRLARMLTALSPKADRRREVERLWFGLRFELLCELVSLKLRCGALPISQMHHLADLVGNLAVRLEKAIQTWLEAGLDSQPASVRT
jgi:hypothetical protein